MDDVRRVLEDKIENYEAEYRKLEINLQEKEADLKDSIWYAECLKKPIKEKQILFWCKGYLNCFDTPRYIFDYLYQTYGQEYKYLWIVKSKKKLPTGLPQEVEFVQRESREFWEALACSKYLIGNVLLPVNFVKRGEQVYLNSLQGVDNLYKKKSTGVNGHSLVLTEMLKTDYLIADSREMVERLYKESYGLADIYRGKVVCMDSLRAAHMKCLKLKKNEKAKCIFLIRNKETYQWFADNFGSLINRQMDCVLVRDQNCGFEGVDISDIIAESDLIISDRSNYMRDAAAYGCKVCCWKESEQFFGFEEYDIVADEVALKEYLAGWIEFRRVGHEVDAEGVKLIAELLMGNEVDVETIKLSQEAGKKKLLFLTDWRMSRERKYTVKRALEIVDKNQYDVTVASNFVGDVYIQEEIKALPQQVRIICYRGKMILDKDEYIIFRMLEKNTHLVSEEPMLMAYIYQLMEREWHRKWGNTTYDVIILLGDKARQYLTTAVCKHARKVMAAEEPMVAQKKKNLEQWQNLWNCFDDIYLPAFAGELEKRELGEKNQHKIQIQQLLFANNEIACDKIEKVNLSGKTYMIADRWKIAQEREQMYLMELPQDNTYIVNMELPATEERSIWLKEFLADKKKVMVFGRCIEEYKDCIPGEYVLLDEFVWKRLYMLPEAKCFFARITGYVGDSALEYDVVRAICKEYGVEIFD